MSARGREGADGPRVPPASTFTVGWRIPAEILEPLLRRPARDGVAADAGSDRAKRSADRSDAESSAE
jgi:hypothetical protein